MGTSIAGMPKKTINEDHPHAYGDKYSLFFYRYRALGSSPRVWGQVTKTGYLPDEFGIIPTRMGTSIAGMPKKTINEDHPHAYGDKKIKSGYSPLFSGSSPRVWGQDTCRR